MKNKPCQNFEDNVKALQEDEWLQEISDTVW